MALYVDTNHKILQRIDRKILDAHLNFLHFTSTESNLSPDQLSDTCHDLLRRSAALQLAPNQATYDQLIPFYCGDPEKPFDENNLGVILVQDINRVSPTTPSAIFGEEFETVSLPKASKRRSSIGARKKRKRSQATTSTSQTGKSSSRQTPYFIFGEMQMPILFLLFDLSAETESQFLEVSRSVAENPTVWEIHSHGHDERTFKCIREMGCVEEAKLFFLSATPRDTKTVLVDSGDLVKYPRHVRYQADDDDADREDGGDNDVR